MKKISIFLFLLFNMVLSAQTFPTKVNEQTRYTSDSRLFYVWNNEKDAYDLRDTEFENSMIDIREIGSKNSGYIVISLVDDGKVRMYHGSIVSYTVDEEGDPTWVIRSKTARGKLVLNHKKKQFTYSFESNETRYVKIFIFSISFGEAEKEE